MFADEILWKSAGYATKFAPHKALQLIVGGKLTFGERVVLHRVDVWTLQTPGYVEPLVFFVKVTDTDVFSLRLLILLVCSLMLLILHRLAGRLPRDRGTCYTE